MLNRNSNSRVFTPRVLSSARVARKTGSTCDRSDFTGAAAATFSCTVSYDKLKVVYTISAHPNGKSFAYTATAPKDARLTAALSRPTRAAAP